MTIVAAASSSSASSKKPVTLKCSDGAHFEVDRERMALLSETVKLAIAENPDSAVHLPDVRGPVLAEIVRYTNEVAFGNGSADDYAAELALDQAMMFDVLMAAHLLKIKPISDLICKKIADMMIGKSTEEIRGLFNIVSDYTEDELKEVKEEIAFLVDGVPPKPEAGLVEKKNQEDLELAWDEEVQEADHPAFGPIPRTESMFSIMENLLLREAHLPVSQWKILDPTAMCMLDRYVAEVYHNNKCADAFAAELAQNQGLMVRVLQAANYLKVEPLCHLVCQTISDGRSREEIWELLDSISDLTEADLEEVKGLMSAFLEANAEKRKQNQAAETSQAMDGNRGESKRAKVLEEPI